MNIYILENTSNAKSNPVIPVF